jgi:hypothetical protein
MTKSRYQIITDEDEKPVTKGRYQLVTDEEQMPSGKVSTMFGELERHPKEMIAGSPQQKNMIDEMINSALPGSGLYAGMRDPLMQMLGKAGRGVINTFKTARSDIPAAEQTAGKVISGAEQKALSAGEEAGIAEKEAEKVKPGLYEKPTTELENIEHEIGKHINIEATHDVPASAAIVNRVKSIEDFWSDAYKQLENKVADAHFQMPEQAMENLQYDQNEIMKRLRAGANPKTVMKEMEAEQKAAQNPYFKDLMEHAPTSADTNAKDFLAKHRDFRDALNGLKQDLKSEAILSGEKIKIREAIEKGKQVQKQVVDTLREGLGDYKNEFDWINKGYREQVFPLRKNPIVKAAQKGKLPKNMAEALRTNESGMPLMRDIVRQDPELLRNVVGQRYKINPADLHHPDALMREYLDEMPQFKRLLQKKEATMKKTAARKDISLKEKMRLEKELSEIKKAKESEINQLKREKKQAKKKIKKAAIGTGVAIGSSLGLPYIFNKTARLFTGD